MPGILGDTLLRTASCGGGSLVDRPNLALQISEIAHLTPFKTILPPLPVTFSQSIKGL